MVPKRETGFGSVSNKVWIHNTALSTLLSWVPKNVQKWITKKKTSKLCQAVSDSLRWQNITDKIFSQVYLTKEKELVCTSIRTATVQFKSEINILVFFWADIRVMWKLKIHVFDQNITDFALIFIFLSQFRRALCLHMCTYFIFFFTNYGTFLNNWILAFSRDLELLPLPVDPTNWTPAKINRSLVLRVFLLTKTFDFLFIKKKLRQFKQVYTFW